MSRDFHPTFSRECAFCGAISSVLEENCPGCGSCRFHESEIKEEETGEKPFSWKIPSLVFLFVAVWVFMWAREPKTPIEKAASEERVQRVYRVQEYPIGITAVGRPALNITTLSTAF